MTYSLVGLFFFAASPVLTAVVQDQWNYCGANEFRCGDGACVSISEVCDGVRACADGSDETCDFGLSNRHMDESRMGERSKRQSRCRRDQWTCRDGTCIGFDAECDGLVDCPDASDESYARCRNMTCQSQLFRCTYGACVDGTAKCNGVMECADNSDELHPDCRKTPLIVQGKFQCDDGTKVSSTVICDGTKDCADGSDETVRVCGAKSCQSFTFQCAYGACVDGGSDCDGKPDCADGSDESDELCNRIGTGTTNPIQPKPTPSPAGGCVLPQFPSHGSYTVTGRPGAQPGQSYDTVFMNVSCDQGYGVSGKSERYCFGNSLWDSDMPTCERLCKLNKNPSVEYRCKVQESDIGTRECNLYEPHGTLVFPACRTPNYYSPQALRSMYCIEGSWDRTVVCIPECGKVTPGGQQLVIGGRVAERGELPWHVGIYRKNVTPYKQICGGSIISTTIVISAAHCFWTDTEKLHPPNRYAVAGGKLFRPWANPVDVDAQKSDVSDLKVPVRFRGSETNFQDDIALVFLSTPFVYQTYVRPVCVDFDVTFNSEQLSPGKLGKAAGWGLTAEDGEASQVLRTVDLPYVTIDDCLTDAPANFREYITSDKICAGYLNGTSLCQGDSGGGLAFASQERAGLRYYLRGIVSTAPRNDAQTSCNSKTYTSFTQILSHEHFIRPYFT